jgi:hypothetical protein
MNTNEIPRRRVVGFLVLVLAAIVGTLAFGTLLASCQQPIVAPSASADGPTQVPSGVPSAGASAGASVDPSPAGSAAPSEAPTGSIPPLPTVAPPNFTRGPGGPSPSIRIPPPIR